MQKETFSLLGALIWLSVLLCPMAAAQKSDINTEQMIQALKRQKLFSVMFRLHPELEVSTKKVIEEHPDSPMESAYIFARDELLGKYLTSYILRASNESVYNFILSEDRILRSLSTDPQLCFDYAQGELRPNKIIPMALLQRNLDAKAEVLETAAANPSLSQNLASMKELGYVLAGEYLKKGYDINNLSKIWSISGLPPAEGCKVATEFSDVLASMDSKQSVYVYKSFLAPTKEKRTQASTEITKSEEHLICGAPAYPEFTLTITKEKGSAHDIVIENSMSVLSSKDDKRPKDVFIVYEASNSHYSAQREEEGALEAFSSIFINRLTGELTLINRISRRAVALIVETCDGKITKEQCAEKMEGLPGGNPFMCLDDDLQCEIRRKNNNIIRVFAYTCRAAKQQF